MTNQTEALDDAFSCAEAALNGPLPRGAVGAILETLRARVDAALSSQPPAPREPEIVRWLLEYTFSGDEKGNAVYESETECRRRAAEDGGVCVPLIRGCASLTGTASTGEKT